MTDDRHIISALDTLDLDQANAWRGQCHTLGQVHTQCADLFTALASAGYDKAGVAVTVALSRAGRETLLELALLLDAECMNAEEPGVRKVWKAAANATWFAEMAKDPIGAQFLNRDGGGVGLALTGDRLTWTLNPVKGASE